MNQNTPDPESHEIKVPRDRRLDTRDGPPMPSPGGEIMKDEDYADQDKPVLPDSVSAKRLQARPPKGTDQLRVGTAGDAARPSKEGIHNKPVPPRGRV